MTDLLSVVQEFRTAKSQLRRVLIAFNRLASLNEALATPCTGLSDCTHCVFQDEIQAARELIKELEENEK